MNEKSNLIYPELSYKIIGSCFKVHSELGGKYQEKYYQRAAELELKDKNISFKREVVSDLSYKNQKIGRYFLDFVIDNKVVLELKTQKDFYLTDIKQVLGHFKRRNFKLGILVNFSKDQLVFKRIINNQKLAKISDSNLRKDSR